MSYFSRSAIIAPKEFNRWLIPPAALAIHLSIGQVYAFSVFKIPLMEHFGVQDVAVGWIFSLAILMLGISSALFGTWVERVGPRVSMTVSGTLWVLGFFIATFGIQAGHLWLVYLGYGFIGGIGLGIGYISPVSTLMKWFPDRPGLATGLAIMGFGGGALIASPASNRMMEFFGGGSDTAQLAAGLRGTFLTLAVLYLVVIALGAYSIRIPHPDWKPSGGPAAPAEPDAMKTTGNVSANTAIKTPQFWLLWIILFTNITAGIGILENAAPMIQDYFPAITAGAAAGFVGLLSLTNMGGRFVWSSLSDIIGRKNIYMVYLGMGLLLYLVVALFGSSNLVVFVACALIILSFYGGGFATIPAYLKDLFGVYQVGAIHGRLLTAWSAAGVAGPLIVNMVLENQGAKGYEGPELYKLSLFIMCGLLAVGLIANILVRPVAEKYMEDPTVVKAKADADRKAVMDAEAEAEAEGHDNGYSGKLHAAVALILALFIGASLIFGLWETAVKAAQMFTA
ncbi:OFA family MFS transporter [Corynebacterium endometrii]|uniref:Putative MFS-type transporter YhjX n=1 Tax=Corynebacterium endometrii TaxID=2488819 RepID=A0A4P7QDT0_9CORY|nr:OFA family MFS transporter [Corynebacterium endometrii]QCB27705.1 putative MFS-type transporter YhjX [Corynebacterium endometrii]